MKSLQYLSLKLGPKINQFRLKIYFTILPQLKTCADQNFSLGRFFIFMQVYTMAEKRRFTTQMIARNMLKKIFVSLFLSVILIITVTI